MKREKLREAESRKLAKLRLRQGIFAVGKPEADTDGICREAESRRQAIVSDLEFWKPIDTASLDCTQADRILQLRKWQADRLGFAIIRQIRSRILKVKSGGFAKGRKALAKGPKRKPIGIIGRKPKLPGRQSEHGKRRYKPTKAGSYWLDKIDLDEATSAASLWLFDTDVTKASLWTSIQAIPAWLPTLSRSVQSRRLEACRQAYFIQDTGLEALPTASMSEALEAIPQADKSKAWGHDTMQHTCKACGLRSYSLPSACEKCGNQSFRSEAIGPVASFIKACGFAVGKALSNRRLRFPGESRRQADLEAGFTSLEAFQVGKASDLEADGKPNKWEPVYESRYRHIEPRRLCRLVLQACQEKPTASRLSTILLAKMRSQADNVVIRSVRRKLADLQAAKIGTDRRQLRKLGLAPPKYSRRQYYYDLADLRKIGKACRLVLEAEVADESQAWFAASEASKPTDIRLWWESEYRRFRRLRKLGQASDLEAWLRFGLADKPKATAFQVGSYGFQPKLRFQDLTIQVDTDRKAEANKRQAYRYCQFWASRAFDRRQHTDKPEAYLQAGFNGLAWNEADGFLQIRPAEEAEALPWELSEATLSAWKAAEAFTDETCRRWLPTSDLEAIGLT